MTQVAGIQLVAQAGACLWFGRRALRRGSSAPRYMSNNLGRVRWTLGTVH